MPSSAVALDAERVDPPAMGRELDTDVAIAKVVVSRKLSYSFTSKFLGGKSMVSVVAECCESDKLAGSINGSSGGWRVTVPVGLCQ